jgi:transcriptional regulator with XRE-family HTH domain
MKTIEGPDDLEVMPAETFSSAGDATSARQAGPSTASAPSFGRALREQRRRRKLSLGQLASSSGMSASYLSRIEHDHLPPPSAKIMRRLASAMNIEVGALQAAAGLIPERIVAVIRDRPAVLTLLTLIARQPDNELFDLCDELLKRRAPSN